MSTVEIYYNANEALDNLSNLWQTMLQLIQSVSVASGSSLTVEPDLQSLQKARKDYQQLVTSLQDKVKWLESHPLPEINEPMETDEVNVGLEEQKQLQKESTRVSDQLKQLLNQSYALQFQMEMLFSSSQNVALN